MRLMDFHALAVFLSVLVYAMTTEALKAEWAKTLARLFAFLLFVWGIYAIHPLCSVLAVAFAFSFAICRGVDGAE